MHVILSYSSNKLKSCVKSKIAFYNKFLAQAYYINEHCSKNFFHVAKSDLGDLLLSDFTMKKTTTAKLLLHYLHK